MSGFRGLTGLGLAMLWGGCLQPPENKETGETSPPDTAETGGGAEDADGDGYSSEAAGGEDCDDSDASVNPGASETWYDGVDQDCSGGSDYDADGDGYDHLDYEGTDCDDEDATFYPGATGVRGGIDVTCFAPGTFTMGSPDDEIGRADDETRHEVTLTRPFAIGVHEVTQAEFEELMGYQPSQNSGCSTCPVETISWHEAAALTNALSERLDLDECYACTGSDEDVSCDLDSSFVDPYACSGFRLPTEAEWEYAARAGVTAAFSSGGNLASEDDAEDCSGDVELDDGTMLDDLALYCGNSDEDTEKVGSREPNAAGLYGVHGNVREWCHDGSTGGALEDATDPSGEEDASERVKRGGSWHAGPEKLRFAERNSDPPGKTRTDLGVRVVRGY